MQVVTDADVFGAEPGGEPAWVERLRVADLSLGTYSLPAGSIDGQEPHSEDEIYVITGGRGRFVTADADVEVGPGTTIFVPAHEPHHFADISEDLVAIVVFAPAEGTREA